MMASSLTWPSPGASVGGLPESGTREDAMSDIATSKTWTGPFRAPRNMAAEAKGSIHDDATATKLGFRGGTVAGSIHLDQFVPHLVETYGPQWFETGGLSLYFTQATVDLEEVQCGAEAGEDRLRLVMHNRDGAMICQGTASAQPDAGSELARRFENQTPAGEGTLRILAAMRVGDENHDLPVRVAPETLARTLGVITETDAAYADGTLPPSLMVHMAHMTREAVMAKSTRPQVALYGALEVQNLAGPLRVGVDYLARTKVLKLTESPKTENVWYEVIFAEGGRDIARVLYFLRVMKNSSPLWAQA